MKDYLFVGPSLAGVDDVVEELLLLVRAVADPTFVGAHQV
jgi:hypothetical protein